MLATLNVRLEARDAEANRQRAYHLEAGRDLLGDWIVDVTFGRIGGKGRRVRYLAADEADARRIAAGCLRRRSSAPKRIGVPYRVMERSAPDGWP